MEGLPGRRGLLGVWLLRFRPKSLLKKPLFLALKVTWSSVAIRIASNGSFSSGMVLRLLSKLNSNFLRRLILGFILPSGGASGYVMEEIGSGEKSLAGDALFKLLSLTLVVFFFDLQRRLSHPPLFFFSGEAGDVSLSAMLSSAVII